MYLWDVMTGKIHAENAILKPIDVHFLNLLEKYENGDQYKKWLMSSIFAAHAIVSKTFIYVPRKIKKLGGRSLSDLKRANNDPNKIPKVYRIIMLYLYTNFISGEDFKNFEFNQDRLLRRLLTVFQCDSISKEITAEILMLPQIPNGGIISLAKHLLLALGIELVDPLATTMLLKTCFDEAYGYLCQSLEHK